MIDEAKYTIKRKDACSLLPFFLQRWKPVGRNLSLDDLVKNLPREDYHTQLIGLKHEGDSTVMLYRETPHWSSEEYDDFHSRQEGRIFPVTAESFSVYRVTPRLKISFAGDKLGVEPSTLKK